MSGRHTLAAPARHLLEARKSRFLAQATHVATPDRAMAWLREVADPQATHNCWAYRIGGAYRSSDDGEPGGSAGRPILAAIDGQGLDEVIVVVTRWYGGTHLGVGGLVRAYGGAAAECLRTAARRERVDWVEIELRGDFSLAGTLHALLPGVGADKLDESFDGEGLALRLRLPATKVEELSARVRDLSRGGARLRRLDPDP